MRHLFASALLALSLLSASAGAQETAEAPDPYLAAAVDALSNQDYQLGFDLLDRASKRTDDPRITYYRAFALEKLGRCDAARAGYEAAANAGPERFAVAANGALRDIKKRCVPTPPAAEPTTSHSVPASRTAVTVGWVLTTVGALAFIALPIKIAFDREVATQSEQYFEQVYECEVTFGELADDCDAVAIKENPQWDTYEGRLRTARKGNIWLIVTGSALVGGGITAIVLGSKKQSVAVVPARGGAAVVWGMRF